MQFYNIFCNCDSQSELKTELFLKMVIFKIRDKILFEWFFNICLSKLSKQKERLNPVVAVGPPPGFNSKFPPPEIAEISLGTLNIGCSIF